MSRLICGVACVFKGGFKQLAYSMLPVRHSNVISEINRMPDGFPWSQGQKNVAISLYIMQYVHLQSLESLRSLFKRGCICKKREGKTDFLTKIFLLGIFFVRKSSQQGKQIPRTYSSNLHKLELSENLTIAPLQCFACSKSPELFRIVSGYLIPTTIKGHNSLTNLQIMTANSPNVDLVIINRYIKFGQNLSICSQEQKRNFGVNHGP